MTSQLKDCSKDGRLLIAVDQEGGRVQRLKEKYGFYGRFPKAKEISEYSDDKVLEIYGLMAQELKSVGINFNPCSRYKNLAINSRK